MLPKNQSTSLSLFGCGFQFLTDYEKITANENISSGSFQLIHFHERTVFFLNKAVTEQPSTQL